MYSINKHHMLAMQERTIINTFTSSLTKAIQISLLFKGFFWPENSQWIERHMGRKNDHLMVC